MGNSNIKRYHRLISMMLLVVMLVTGLPYDVFADVNVDTGGSGGSGTSGASSNWALPRENSGRFAVRMAVYWAPSLADMENGVNVEQVGKPVDIANARPVSSKYAKAKYSTEFSVMEYMGFNDVYTVRHTGSEYSKHKLVNSGNLVTTQPDIEKDPSAQEWIDWFEGKDASGQVTYKVVEEITKHTGVPIKASDFKNGIKEDISGIKVTGQYKIFFEPVLYGVYGGNTQGMTFRDMIFYTIARDKGELNVPYLNGPKEWGGNNKITSNMKSAPMNVANPTFLAKDEKAINMIAKNPASYKVTRNNSTAALKPGSVAYNSMGVGVVTPPAKEAPKNKVLVSYVKVVDYKDGKFIYETIKETEEEAVKYVKGKESEGIIDIDTVREVEEGTALLNDIITTKNDYTEKVVEKKKEVKDLVWETGIKPKLKEEPIVEPEELYGGLHGIVLHNIEDEVEPEIKAEAESKVGLPRFNTLAQGVVKKLRVFNNVVDVINELSENAYKKNKEGFTVSQIDRDIMTPGGKLDYVRYSHEGAIALQKADIQDGGAVQATPNKSRVLDEELEGLVEEEINKAGNGEKPVLAHLRYIVLPESMQFHLTTTKIGDKVLTKTQENFKLPVDPENPVNIPLKELHPKEKLVKWYIVPGGNIPDLTVSLPPKKPNTPESTETLEVPEITPGDNVVVIWEIIEEEPPVVPKGERVPEWRISKYNKELPGGLYAYMGMTLRPDSGHGRTSLTPSGKYNFYRINPNNKRNDDSDTPANKKFQDWLHSKTIAKSSDTVTHDKPSAKIEVTGDLNLVKSTKLDGIKLAKWITGNKNLSAYDVETDFKGTPFGGPSDINKAQKVTYGIENKDRYTHVYPVYYHPKVGKRRRCHCYLSEETPSPTYIKAERNIESLFERYKQVETDKKVLNVAASKDEKNGITRVVMQQEKPITVYPEYPMLFQDNKGEHSIQVAVSDRGRQIKPVMYYTMEYNLFVEPKSTGTSVATDSRARQKAGTMGGGNKQVIHKGAGVNSSFNVTGLQGKDRGKLKITSYALDFSNKQVKEVWGNNWYSPEKINQDFLSKWSFKGEARENLVVTNPGGAGEAYIGPTKLKKSLEYTNKKQTKVENLKLEVRGAELYKVDNRLVETYKTGSQRDKDIYEALEKMRLVGKNKDETLFATFEQKAGRPLTEDLYKSMAAKSRNGHDKLEVGKGWYSEDTTVLELKVIHTELDIPSNMYSDKLPMTIRGLESPMNKNQFYSQMSKGHTRLNYLVKSADLGQGLGEVKSYFEVQSNKELQVKDKKLNKVTVDYLVPNVSITDTMGYN